MQVHLSLENVHLNENRELEFRVYATSDSHSDFFNELQCEFGLAIDRPETHEKHILSSDVEVLGNHMICRVPMDKFRSLESVKGRWDLAFYMELDDLPLLSIQDNLKESFSIQLPVHAAKESYFLQTFSVRNRVGLRIGPIASLVNVAREEDGCLLLKGDLVPIPDLVYTGDFFLRNSVSNETIDFHHTLVPGSGTEYEIRLNLKNGFLYEGEWDLFSRAAYQGKQVNVSVLYSIHHAPETLAFASEEQLYQGSLVTREDGTAYLLITKPTESSVVAEIKAVTLDSNRLTVQWAVQPDSIDNPASRFTGLVFIHRDTKAEYRCPLDSGVMDESLLTNSLLFEDADFIKDEGWWDVFAEYEIRGASQTTPLLLSAHLDEQSDFVVLPKTVYSRSGQVKRVTPSVVDNQLSLLVSADVLRCDIQKIEYEAQNFSVQGWLSLPNVSSTLEGIYLVDELQNLSLPCMTQSAPQDNGVRFRFSFDWDSLNPTVIQQADFRVVARIDVEGYSYDIRLISNVDGIANKSTSVMYPPLNKSVQGYPFEIKPYYTERDELSVALGNSIKASCVALEKKRNKLYLSVRLDCPQDVMVSGVSLACQGSQIDARTAPEARVQGSTTYRFCLDEAFANPVDAITVELRSSLLVTVGEFEVESAILADTASLVKHNHRFKTNAIKISARCYFSLTFNKESGELIGELRNLKAEEKKRDVLKFFLASLLAACAKPFVRRPVWLIGENLGEVAQDNGFAFFEFCVKNNVRENYYYVSVPNNKNANNLVPYQNKVVRYDSFKHLMLYHLSEYLIVSHGIRDVIPGVLHRLMAINPKRVIYLQHGIIAMKKVYFNARSYNGKIQKFVVSSEHERGILLNQMRFNSNQVMVTGLARFDGLVDKSKERKPKEIVVLPTWRDWSINSREGFMRSPFFTHYQALLRDPRVHQILEQHNLVLKFYPHIEIQKKYSHEFSVENDRVRMVNVGEENIQDLIQNASLMITDYSSVALDFNYLRKPVVFYHFDLDDYMKHRGAFVDLRKDLPGDIAYTQDQLVQLLAHYVNAHFEYKRKYLMVSQKFYDHHDHNNSRRIYQEIVQNRSRR